MVDKKRNKIGHSSRSSSIQRIKTNADQRCLIITISENLAFQFLLIRDGLKTKRKKTKRKAKKRVIYKKNKEEKKKKKTKRRGDKKKKREMKTDKRK